MKVSAPRGMDMVEKLFQAAISHNANDIHLAAGVAPALGTGGKLARMKADPFTSEDIEQMRRQGG
ncbi:MAG: hypothetical protein HY885_17305 [Deltaproteobacteria bacterium]|nr:hypothetical protein [Deltaproteobacteria bacterium]